MSKLHISVERGKLYSGEQLIEMLRKIKEATDAGYELLPVARLVSRARRRPHIIRQRRTKV